MFTPNVVSMLNERSKITQVSYLTQTWVNSHISKLVIRAKEHIARTYSGEETGGKGDIRISNAADDKYLSQSAVDKSESKDVHLAVLKVLPDVIRESVDAE